MKIMLCKKPWIRQPTGLSKLALALSEEARERASPFPCGQCLHCRINRAERWTMRILLESKYHAKNCFVTLTYDDEFLPPLNSLCKSDYQKFIKRLRMCLARGIKDEKGKKVKSPEKNFKYYLVGEYGTTGTRKINPHYHIAIFGLGQEHEIFINEAWKFKEISMGRIHVGNINKDSARYISGYVVKGLYQDNDYFAERLGERIPEFSRMSREYPLGWKYLEKLARKEQAEGKKIDTVRINQLNYLLDKTLKKKVEEVTGYKPDFDVRLWQERMFIENHDNKYGGVINGIKENYKTKRANREYKYNAFNRKNRASKQNYI
jgi:hypothetical protein